jgi:hypothetical protein
MLNNNLQSIAEILSHIHYGNWNALSINSSLKNDNDFFEHRHFEIVSNDHYQIKIDKKDYWNLEIFKNKKILSQTQDNITVIKCANLFVHQVFKNLINHKIAWLKNNDEKNDVNNQEFRSLQWIQATLTVLNKAIAETAKNKDLVLQAQIFSGVREKQDVLRLIILSLDIEIYFLPAKILEVKVTDLHQGKLVFQQFFSIYKNEFFDEIIKTLNELGFAQELK